MDFSARSSLGRLRLFCDDFKSMLDDSMLSVVTTPLGCPGASIEELHREFNRGDAVLL